MAAVAVKVAGNCGKRTLQKPGYCWGTKTRVLRYRDNEIKVERLRVRARFTGREILLPSWEEASTECFLEPKVMAVMLMGPVMARNASH